MIIGDTVHSPAAREALPVFHGLERAAVSGKEIAEASGVTPPTVSKWRKGKARPPASTQVFLTLILAHWIGEMERMQEMAGGWRMDVLANLKASRNFLELQEAYNITLPPQAVREGTRMFRVWWNRRPDCQAAGHPSVASRQVA